MENQTSFAQAEYAGKKKQTRRERFLGEMEGLVPWARLVALIVPFYPKGARGRPPMGIEKMLRVYFLQQWYSLADEALEDALYDSQALRTFVGIDLGSGEAVPDATTLLHFRHLLERHALTRALFAEVNALLSERGILLREGTLVDATIIAAPASTKNKAKARDPEMHQTRTRDESPRRPATLTGTAANVAERNPPPAPRAVGYTGVEKRAEIVAKFPHVVWQVAASSRRWPIESPGKCKAQLRAYVEHPFHVVKNLFKHRPHALRPGQRGPDVETRCRHSV